VSISKNFHQQWRRQSRIAHSGSDSEFTIEPRMVRWKRLTTLADYATARGPFGPDRMCDTVAKSYYSIAVKLNSRSREASNSGSILLREARTKAQESYLAGVVYSTCRVNLSRYTGPCRPNVRHYNVKATVA